MSRMIEDIMARRRDKAIAVALSVKERLCDEYLPEEASRKLRKAILDQFNDYHDLCVDLVRSVDTGGAVVNEVYLAKLDEVLSAVLELVEDH